MIVRLWFSVLAICAVIGSAYADCGSVSIMVVNDTDTLCRLQTSELRHGYFDLVSIEPAYIPPHSTAPAVVLSQGFRGSDLTLTYACGEQRQVSLNVRHPYRLFTAGKIVAEVVSSQNIAVEYHIMDGSCLWSEHGSVEWLLK